MGKGSSVRKCFQCVALSSLLLLLPRLAEAEETEIDGRDMEVESQLTSPGLDPAKFAEQLEQSKAQSDQPTRRHMPDPYEQQDMPDDLKDDIWRGRSTHLSLSEMDLLRQQISGCWSPPRDATKATDLVVIVKTWLNPDGSLSRMPQVQGSSEASSSRRAAEEAALRAVLRCAPYQLPVEKYLSWHELEFTFSSSQMLGR